MIVPDNVMQCTPDVAQRLLAANRGLDRFGFEALDHFSILLNSGD